MTQKIFQILFTILFLSSPAFAQFTGFEEEIPRNFKSSDTHELALSSSYYKEGCKSLEWKFSPNSTLNVPSESAFTLENDNGITVVLDTNLSEELLEEGFVREIISKVQTMRKEAGFEVMDKIFVTYEGTEKAGEVFAGNAAVIGEETLAVSIEGKTPAGYVKEWKINGEKVTLGVERI